MAHTKIESESIDIAVFCLSLMGTNLGDYLKEANRLLKPGGLLKVAEVSSRFSSVSGFIGSVKQWGFQILNQRELSSMFHLMDFKKTKAVKKSSQDVTLKPCVYKKR